MITMVKYTDTSNGHRCLDSLRMAVQFSWFRPAEILARLDLWSEVLAECFEAALEDDWSHIVALPANVTGPRGITEDRVENILDNFNDWLGKHVVYEVLAGELDG